MDTPSRRDGVVLLHGHRGILRAMRVLERSIERAGYRIASPNYPSTTLTLAGIVDHVEPSIRTFAASVEGQVHIVGHSLGGLITRALLHRAKLPNLGRVVMLSTPHEGSEWADLVVKLRLHPLILGPVGAHLITARAQDDADMLGDIDYPVGIIAGDTPLRKAIPSVIARPNDGTVSVASTQVAGMADHIVLPVTHATMPINKVVQRQTLAFLQHGKFDRGDGPQNASQG